MLPPGMSFNAVSDKALAASKGSQMMSRLAWDDMLIHGTRSASPYTPRRNAARASTKASRCLHEEGLDNVFARHQSLLAATRHAVRGLGAEVMCRDAKYYSPTITACCSRTATTPTVPHLALENFNSSTGGASPLCGKFSASATWETSTTAR